MALPVSSEPWGSGPASPGAPGPVDAHCRWCGSPSGACDQVSCRRELDPPRFCPACGRRARVVVTPAGFAATCRDHGAIPG